MANKETLTEIRKTIEGYVGKAVLVHTDKGRKRVKQRVGVIVEAYASVFVVVLDDGLNLKRKVSFSYTDVLTDAVEIVLATSDAIAVASEASVGAISMPIA